MLVEINRNPGHYWYGGRNFTYFKGKVFEVEPESFYANRLMLVNCARNRKLMDETYPGGCGPEEWVGAWWIESSDCIPANIPNKEAIHYLKLR